MVQTQPTGGSLLDEAPLAMLVGNLRRLFGERFVVRAQRGTQVRLGGVQVLTTLQGDFRPEHERIRIGGRGGLLIGFRARACCEQRAKHGGAEAASERSSGIHRETTIAGNLPTLVIPLTFPDRKSTRLNSSHVKISYAVF